MEILSNENFSSILLKYRKDNNLTLQQMVKVLACESCKSAGFLSEVERGLKKPNTDMVFAFEKLLKPGVSELTVAYEPENKPIGRANFGLSLEDKIAKMVWDSLTPAQKSEATQMLLKLKAESETSHHH